MSQQVRRGIVEAAFSRESVEIQFAPGLFRREKRLIAVVGDGGTQVTKESTGRNTMK